MHLFCHFSDAFSYPLIDFQWTGVLTVQVTGPLSVLQLVNYLLVLPALRNPGGFGPVMVL